MAKTPVDLYRKGNATSPRMNNVRPNKDIAVYEQNGELWVRETLEGGQEPGGVSTFAIQGNGKNWWKLDAGTEIQPELELINDRGNHWLWKPRQAMPIEQYKAVLQQLGEFFYKVS